MRFVIGAVAISVGCAELRSGYVGAMEIEPIVPFDEPGGLVFVTQLPGSAADFESGRRGFDAIRFPAQGPPLWVHLDRTKPRAQEWLRRESGIDPVAVESLVAEETRPRAEEFANGLLVILRGINANPGAEPDELIAIRMWLDPTHVVTLRQFRFRTIAALRVRAQGGQAPTTAGAFLVAVATGLVAHLSPTIHNLEERLDDIEEEMLAHDRDDQGRRSDLATLRRQAIAYRRHIVPQRDALAALVHSSSPVLSARDRAELRAVMEQCTRVAEGLEELRDRAAVTQDEMRARTEARVGRTVYLLTLVATIALPLGFLTGLLGINVGGVPLAGSPWGFAAVCAVLLVLTGLQVWFFRRRGWL